MVTGITHSAPQYNAARRIKWLLFAFVTTTLACVAGWFVVANTIDSRLSQAITQHVAAGGSASCANQTVRGFPFRFGVFCDAATYADPQVSASVGSIRSAAQFYNPRHIIIEADAPLALTTPAASATVTWEAARASIIDAQPLPRRASVEMRQPRLEMTTIAAPLAAQALTAHMRSLDEADDRGGETGDLDIAALITAPDLSAWLGGAALPAFNLDLDATLKQLARRYLAGERETLVTDTTLTLHRAAILLSDDSGVLLDGSVSTDAQGRLSGTVTIRIIDVDAVIDALGKAFPANQNMIGLFASLPRSGDNNDETSLDLTIAQGRMSLGLIPLGTLPPLIR